MKEKRLIAMFITSIVTLVASITISLGVAFALADPVAAVNLAEISYNVSSYNQASQTVIFNPSGAFNGVVSENILVNSYEEIFYENELVCDQIKLLKILVTNDTNADASFAFRISVKGETNAIKYVFKHVYNLESGEYLVPNGEGVLPEVVINSGAVQHYIVMAYVSDEYALEVLELNTYMEMKVDVIPTR